MLTLMTFLLLSFVRLIFATQLCQGGVAVASSSNGATMELAVITDGAVWREHDDRTPDFVHQVVSQAQAIFDNGPFCVPIKLHMVALTTYRCAEAQPAEVFERKCSTPDRDLQAAFSTTHSCCQQSTGLRGFECVNSEYFCYDAESSTFGGESRSSPGCWDTEGPGSGVVRTFNRNGSPVTVHLLGAVTRKLSSSADEIDRRRLHRSLQRWVQSRAPALEQAWGSRYDAVVWFSGRKWPDSVAGQAELAGMCDRSRAGLTLSVRPGAAVADIGRTLAHELAHTFGAVHDAASLCSSATSTPVMCASGVAEAAGLPRWSAASVAAFAAFVEASDDDGCLSDGPAADSAGWRLQRCGDGRISACEQCDAGPDAGATAGGGDVGCNRGSCRLQGSAVCDGCSACCRTDGAAVLESNSVCRAARSALDQTERCDGISGECPADARAPLGAALADVGTVDQRTGALVWEPLHAQLPWPSDDIWDAGCRAAGYTGRCDARAAAPCTQTACGQADSPGCAVRPHGSPRARRCLLADSVSVGGCDDRTNLCVEPAQLMAADARWLAACPEPVCVDSYGAVVAPNDVRCPLAARPVMSSTCCLGVGSLCAFQSSEDSCRATPNCCWSSATGGECVSGSYCATPEPTPQPTPRPTQQPTARPTPLFVETRAPTPKPTYVTRAPSPRPTTPSPTVQPTPRPTNFPTPRPTFRTNATPSPTNFPTSQPTPWPTPFPSPQPTPLPTFGERTPGPTAAAPSLMTAAPTFACPPGSAGCACLDGEFCDDADGGDAKDVAVCIAGVCQWLSLSVPTAGPTHMPVLSPTGSPEPAPAVNTQAPSVAPSTPVPTPAGVAPTLRVSSAAPVDDRGWTGPGPAPAIVGAPPPGGALDFGGALALALVVVVVAGVAMGAGCWLARRRGATGARNTPLTGVGAPPLSSSHGDSTVNADSAAAGGHHGRHASARRSAGARSGRPASLVASTGTSRRGLSRHGTSSRRKPGGVDPSPPPHGQLLARQKSRGAAAPAPLYRTTSISPASMPKYSAISTRYQPGKKPLERAPPLARTSSFQVREASTKKAPGRVQFADGPASPRSGTGEPSGQRSSPMRHTGSVRFVGVPVARDSSRRSRRPGSPERIASPRKGEQSGRAHIAGLSSRNL